VSCEEKLFIFAIKKVHGKETWWLRESFLASKMRKNSPTCICNFKNISGVIHRTPVKMGERMGWRGRGRGRKVKGREELRV
jgi:hypothetical protein